MSDEIQFGKRYLLIGPGALGTMVSSFIAGRTTIFTVGSILIPIARHRTKLEILAQLINNDPSAPTYKEVMQDYKLEVDDVAHTARVINFGLEKFKAWTTLEPAVTKPNIPTKFPHICISCKAPAYIGFAAYECSNNACKGLVR